MDGLMEFEEGCPDCGQDTVVADEVDLHSGVSKVHCSTCGWLGEEFSDDDAE